MTTQMMSVAEFDAIVDQIVDAVDPVCRETELYPFLAARSHNVTGMVQAQS